MHRSLTLLILLLCYNPVFAQSDFFYSLNSGIDVVNEPLDLELAIGDEATISIYYTTNGPTMTDLTYGSLVVATSESGIVDIIGGGGFNFDITVAGTPIGVRWQIIEEKGTISDDSQSMEFLFFNVGSGSGVLNFNTGPVFFDEGYDADADAFLFGQVSVRRTGPGDVYLTTSSGALDFINGNDFVDLTLGSVHLIDDSFFLFGDLNGDGVVTLLDVGIFVDLLINGEYDKAADFDCNDSVDLLDVQPFIDAINFP